MTDRLYDFLYDELTLKTVGLVVGLALVISHGLAFVKSESVKAWLPSLPRNEKIGIGLMAVCFAWALLVWSEMDLGEFFTVERPVQIIIVVGFFLVIQHVKEFIAARAIGFFLIMAACPVLDAAFLEPPKTRLLLVALAYAWIIKGMFWVGMPYLMRDQITWAMADPKRWKLLTLGGVGYGLAVLVCAILFY